MTAASPAAPAAQPVAEPAIAPRRRWWPEVVLVWLLVAAAYVAADWADIFIRKFHDPDDQLRLVQVRDLLAGQNWFDLHQYRIAVSDGGVAMHWSRLVDAPIVAIIALLTPILGPAQAELAALVLMPALTLLAVMAVVGWMAARTLSRSEGTMALVAIAFATPVMAQLTPLRIDHHGWQIALALGAVAAFLVNDERRGGLATGAALATWMAISLEGLPFSALLIAITAAWALADGAKTARLAAIMQSLAVTSAAVFLLTRGVVDLANHCDAIAPVHLAIFGWGALAISLPIHLRPGGRIALLAGLGVAGAGAVTIVALAAPQCTTGTFDMIDPVVRRYWLDNVLEGMPLWQTQPALMAQYCIPPLIGIWCSVSLARRTEGEMRNWWLFYASILACATAVAFMVSRSASISGALTLLPLGWRFSQWLNGLKRPPNPFLRVGELVGVAVLMFCVAMPAVPVLAVQSVFDAELRKNAKTSSGITCPADRASGVLNGLPAGGILAPLDYGPSVLLHSNRTVLATGHHRGAGAMRDVIDAFTGSPERARAIMARRGLRYVLICPKVPEIQLYRKSAPKGFAADILAGQVPGWLRPVALPEASRLKLWALAEEPVSPAGTSAPRR